MRSRAIGRAAACCAAAVLAACGGAEHPDPPGGEPEAPLAPPPLVTSRTRPEAIVAAARDEDVDVIGLSILSGSHMPICARIKELMRESGIGDKIWLVGGNIPRADRPKLLEMGADGVFPTGSSLDDISSFIREQVQ